MNKYIQIINKNIVSCEVLSADFRFQRLLNLNEAKTSSFSINYFAKSFIEIFCNNKLDGINNRASSILTSSPRAKAALLSQYFMDYHRNDFEQTLTSINNAVDLIQIEFNNYLSKNKLSKNINDIFTELDFYLTLYLQCDVVNKDFAKDNIPLNSSRNLIKDIVSWDRKNKKLPILLKLLRANFESHSFNDSISLLKLVESKYSCCFKSRLAIIKTAYNMPKRALKLSDENIFEDYRTELTSNFHSLAEGRFIADYNKITCDTPDLIDLLAIYDFSKFTLNYDLSNKTKQLLEQSDLFNSAVENGKYLNVAMDLGIKSFSDIYNKYSFDGSHANLIFSELVNSGDFDEAYKLFKEDEAFFRSNLVAVFKLLSSLKKYDEFEKLLVDVLNEDFNFSTFNAPLFTKLNTVFELWHDARFLKTSISFYDSYPQTKDKENGIIVTCAQGVKALRHLPIPILVEMKRRGWKVVHLCNNYFMEDSGYSSSGAYERLLNNKQSDWNIIYEDELAVKDNINYWKGIHEHVSIGLRRYHLDYNTLRVKKDFLYRKRSADAGVESLKELISEVDPSTPIRVLMWDPHTTPGHAMRLYCESQQLHGDVEVINYKNGHENLGSAKEQLYSQKLSIANLTRDKINFARLGSPNGFERWLENQDDIVANELPIIHRDLTKEQTSYLDELKSFRNSGGRVYCLLGKVIFDLCEPLKSGLVHESMEDWVNHTIRTIANDEKIKLIVKPHPQELKNTIALFGAEGLKDLVKESSVNVDVIEPDFIGLDVLLPHLDLAIMWSGSSCLELAQAKVPTIWVSRYAYGEMPIGITEPTDLADYESILKTGVLVSDLDRLKVRAQNFFKYIKSDDVAYPYRYTNRPLTNKNIWPVACYQEDFDAYRKNGRAVIENMCDDVF
ncbi:hypothetical protein [Vibrio aquimaris]|uniref:Capsule polysaccharide biosynthesis protein n=1 Tax=Vibrio aquimaris TaxID=2587862 RepID=A0A5P9CEY3_9VIBR|nr:hypothetical protein [Vibrio aquimaris]QFT24858.1 hypothetical protein FIV01_00060 [Vibrio aquimaris]